MRQLMWIILVLLISANIYGQNPLAITNVTVISATSAPSKINVTVIITGNKISAIGQNVKIPKDAQIIHATGKFLIPGLWDMHVHFDEAERSFPLFIANGVLGVRNLGGKQEQIFTWREEVATGKRIGPRVVFCGSILDGEPTSTPNYSITVKDASEARAAVQTLHKKGAEFIKVYDALSRKAYFAIVAEAKKLHLPIVGHVPLSLTSVEVSNAGQKSFEHLGSILESSSTVENELRNWQSEPMKEGDFSVIPRRIAARGTRMLDTWDKDKAADLYKLFVKNQTWQTPTLMVKYTQTFIDDLFRAGDERTKFMPAKTLEWWSPEKNFFARYRTPEYIVFKKRLFQKELEITGAMQRAGVPILAGTDLSGAYIFPGSSLHDELGLLVRAGLTPLAALQTATINPAKFFGEEKLWGAVMTGKLANLVLLEANPLENIANTKNINAVILQGKYFSKDELQKLLAEAANSAQKN